MQKQIKQVLQIRYVRLHFYLTILENATLPKYKTSALRGGFGEMLLRSNCISNRNCEQCGFASECIVQRIMYARFETQNKPAFVTQGESTGYVFECSEHQESYQAGDTLQFRLVLFGKTIVYLNQILQAFYLLGQTGIGREHAKFYVQSIRNSRNEILMEDNRVFMERYRVQTVWEYVQHRMGNENGWNQMRFLSPLSVKYQGEWMKQFQEEAIMAALLRRIYMLDCFEGFSMEKLLYTEYPLRFLSQNACSVSVKRFSDKRNQAMWLRGIQGKIEMEMEDVNEDTQALLLAGELIHIGKNTSFGFGQYRLDRKRSLP